jgi:hypothetical protein
LIKEQAKRMSAGDDLVAQSTRAYLADWRAAKAIVTGLLQIQTTECYIDEENKVPESDRLIMHFMNTVELDGKRLFDIQLEEMDKSELFYVKNLRY